MGEMTDNFAWTQRLQCSPTLCNDSVKRILSKGILEFLWEDISNSVFTVAEVDNIRKNILLYKLKNASNDSTIASVRQLSQLRSDSNTLQHQISLLEEEYEKQDYIVRQKMQLLKDIKSKCSMIDIRKDFLKLKHSDTKKQLKDYGDIRQICQYLMPSTSKDIDQQILKENLKIVADLRLASDKEKINISKIQKIQKILKSFSNIEIHTLWTHLYQALSQDLDVLMKFEIKNDLSNVPVAGENIDIGLARTCGQQILMKSKCLVSDAKCSKYQKYTMELIDAIQISSQVDISEWLTLLLEVKKLETERVCLQNELEKLKNNIQENISFNFNLTQLTTDIETIDVQIDDYVNRIEKSITILNSTSSLISTAKEKLSKNVQRIIMLQNENYDSKCLDNSLDTELDVFYNLDLNALPKIMLKGDVRVYRHAICGLNRASVTTINSQCTRIRSYFPMIHVPIYSLVECYKNAVANIIYNKLPCLLSMGDVEGAIKLAPSQERFNSVNLELLNYSRVVCNRAREEIKHFDAILNTWMKQEVQEAMVLDETTVDDVPFKDWLHRYNMLLYMMQNDK